MKKKRKKVININKCKIQFEKKCVKSINKKPFKPSKVVNRKKALMSYMARSFAMRSADAGPPAATPTAADAVFGLA